MASIARTHAVGRRTRCDNCERQKPDCLWIQRSDNPESEYLVCRDCRAAWMRRGVTLTNTDQDFREVAL